MKLRFSSPRHKNVLIVLAVVFAFFFADHLHLLSFHEDAAIDLRLRLRGPLQADRKITIIEIDDRSLEAIGTWPWPGKMHSTLIGILEKYRPAVILYDVFFAPHSSEAGDLEELAVTMERQGNVVLPFLLSPDKPEPLFPPGNLKESARALGYMLTPPDADGHVRRIPLSISFDNMIYYHDAVLGVLSQIRDEETARRWLAGIPVNRENQFLINFPGPLDSFQRIPFYRVLSLAQTSRDDELRRLFQDKIVLVGVTATGSHSLQPVAFSPAFPSVAIHASAVDTLLADRLLRPAGPLYGFLCTLLLCLLVVLFIELTGPRKAAAFVTAAIVIYSALNYFLFRLGWVLPLFVPVIAAGFSYLLLFFKSDLELHFKGRLLERELSMASRIQESFLPHSTPELSGIDLAFACRFAKEVGGDFYDWIDLGDSRLGIAVGDVSGKGVPAALYMARALSEFRRENQGGRDPAQVLNALNRQLAVRSFAGMFITLTYVIVDQKEKRLSISCAGHEPALYFDRSAKRAEVLHFKKGPPVGVFTDFVYTTVERTYAEGDVLLLLSDGVTELRNREGTSIGIEEVRRHFESTAFDEGAEAITNGLIHRMDEHLGGTKAHDDRTLLCVKFGHPF